MKLFKHITNSINYFRKRETLRYLQTMSDRQLVDCGFLPTLVQQGVNGWPWREDDQYQELSVIDQKIKAEKRSIKELQGYTDAELADLGICRGSIKEVVRHGRTGSDYSPVDRAA